MYQSSTARIGDQQLTQGVGELTRKLRRHHAPQRLEERGELPEVRERP